MINTEYTKNDLSSKELIETNINNTEIYEIPNNIHLLFKIGFYLVSIISVFGNCLIIYVVIRNKRMHNVTNYFITNLAFVDIIISLFSTPFQVN